MRGIEIYDLWLRTGHGDPLDWIEFMCEGEGPFGDCLENKNLDTWPGNMILQHSSDNWMQMQGAVQNGKYFFMFQERFVRIRRNVTNPQ